ncbi:hypothetical protein K491DRAFT_587303 [Lophiostoma macrostomum CBS 122681]|uniref:Zn(2)-C6 fungal-type domain-containing protein n=1 Tax=Lophiostoma macrostomum CBS 122681 TaxID=1314788 RepID=A0A6A6TMS8_9PLEO|nr:hypothetical protein K491DRAFT_587303 [Lophiostoma macrostomum CBS 122681]
MHILALPPPTSLPPTPFGRRQEPVSSLAKLHPQFSPARSEHHSYPSPPMSDSHSPSRRSTHLVEPQGHPYHPPVNIQRRLEALPPPPPPPSFDPRSGTSVQGLPHQRPLYPGEVQPNPQPLHYQPGRAIEPPYGSLQIPQNYAFGYTGHGPPSFLGSQGPGPQAQPTALIAPQPLRHSKPARRTKAHVASACVNCKKAHLSCDVQRPCGRCVASGKQDSCKDVQHKKRGRPRLRDDKEFSRSEEHFEGRPAPAKLLGALPSTSPNREFPPSHRQRNPHRVLNRPQDAEGIPNLQSQPHAPSVGGRPISVGSLGGVAPSPYATGPTLAYQSLPVAFLNLDLVILKSNQAFQELVAFLGDVRGKNLADLLDSRQTDVLHRMRNELRDERDEREPTYMAPITPLGRDPVQSVPETEVDQVSQGYTDRPFVLNFRLPSSQHQSLQTQVRLAKTSLYFVTVVVHTPPRPTGPPLLTQQLAPPTPIRASQTLSAPTTAPARDFGSYSARPSSSASSAPTSPYYNFSSVRTSLPMVVPSSYGNSPSYNYSPTAGPEQGYFPTIQPPSQPALYSSPYPQPPVPRANSALDSNRAPRLEGLQLPPIRTAPAPPLASPRTQQYSEPAREGPTRRLRESPTSAERPDTPDTGKRRRLNIHEVLE